MTDLIYDYEEKLDNGNTIYYREKDGTFFEVGIFIGKENKLEVYSKVDAKLMNIINNYRNNGCRVRIWYGDTKTGRSWNEEYDVTGTIGRSCGTIKIPIFLNNSRSHFGGAILIGSIIRIDDIEDKRTLWQVDNFHVEKMTIEHCTSPRYSGDNLEYPYSVIQHKDDGSLSNIANFKTEKSARNYIDFLEGKRYRK